ncbi:HAMP domain-containing sensor histidine kinase [Paenibacillus chitinolyticus]|uniref:sensor histidine kinase n=1 Tax=Paenibacillus chitinolyticus TaxID=79263 RepID=UPI002DB78130|nr:HAMP domain-containing sensor histidine kinase [Paenibacillus chitinolyticus]MEC0249336.1 HAMP domain-containing sensor histidine kinase [Paenibacillus chitinolyticus]
MSIRTRLLLSYIAMLVIPLILVGLTVTGLYFMLIQDLKREYHIDLTHGNPLKEVAQMEDDNYNKIRSVIAMDPGSAGDPGQWKQWEALVERVNMGLIIRKDEQILYISPTMNHPDVLNSLPAFSYYSGLTDSQLENNYYLLRHHDFTFPDGGKGSIFIGTHDTIGKKYFLKYGLIFLAVLIAVLVLTNGMMTYLMSRSLITPIRALQRSAEHIKEGRLDIEVRPASSDEIGELAVSFEEMRRRLKQSIELQMQYEENRKQLISNISHDLKTPVTAIKGYVEGIMDGVTNSQAKFDRYLQTVYSKTVDIDRMIDELFLYSKLDLRKLPFQFEEADLTAYLKDCVEDMQFDMEKKGIRLTLELSSEEPLPVVIDREKLRRVLTNITENAQKYRDKPEGHIRIFVLERPEFVVIGVHDNGQGIPSDVLPHIFDRFYRGDPSRSSQTGGSGLGLAIAKQIVEEHGGTIWANSRFGEGTTIQFTVCKNRDEKGRMAT